MDVAATMTSKGQITLPKGVRDALGLRAGDRVMFRVHEGRAVLAKVPVPRIDLTKQPAAA